MNNECGRKVYIVDGSRTPQLKSRGKVGPFSAGDLAILPLLPPNHYCFVTISLLRHWMKLSSAA